jgi:hypothetical protein
MSDVRLPVNPSSDPPAFPAQREHLRRHTHHKRQRNQTQRTFEQW